MFSNAAAWKGQEEHCVCCVEIGIVAALLSLVMKCRGMVGMSGATQRQSIVL